jgi:acyl dehydratase
MSVLHEVRARNLATTSNNKIHDDAIAREYGFAGGLVPGVDVYAYAIHAVVAHFGEQWLTDGAIDVRFVQPVYDGHRTTVESEADADNDSLVLTVRDDTGATCAEITARLGVGPAPAPRAGDPVPRPDPVPAASPSSLAPGTVLGTWFDTFDADTAREYLDAISENAAIYREQRIAHPGWLLRRANQVLAANVTMGPWIHVGSEVQLFGTARNGDLVRTDATVTREWDRRGHRFVTLDVFVTAEERVVMRAAHTAIYEPRKRQ